MPYEGTHGVWEQAEKGSFRKRRIFGQFRYQILKEIANILIVNQTIDEVLRKTSLLLQWQEDITQVYLVYNSFFPNAGGKRTYIWNKQQFFWVGGPFKEGPFA